MSDFVSEAIAFVQGNPPREDDPGSLDKVYAGCRQRVMALNTRATGALHAFKSVPNENETDTFVLTTEFEASNSTIALANELWRWIGGYGGPDYAEAVLSAACVEFTRCQFNSSLVGIAFDVSDFSLHDTVRLHTAAIPEQMIVRPWHDAGAIARAPLASYWFDEPAASDFNEWLNETERNTPGLDDHALLSAICLIWIDEAVFCPRSSLSLMSEVAFARHDAGFRWGWEAGEGDAKEESKSFAKRGADARHALNRARRDEIVAAYESGEYGTVKDRAALALSERFGVSWRTVREYLMKR